MSQGVRGNTSDPFEATGGLHRLHGADNLKTVRLLEQMKQSAVLEDCLASVQFLLLFCDSIAEVEDLSSCFCMFVHLLQ